MASRAMQRRDVRLLDQSVRALLRVSDWLSDLRTVESDPIDRDKLGELIHAVETLKAEAEQGGPDAER